MFHLNIQRMPEEHTFGETSLNEGKGILLEDEPVKSHLRVSKRDLVVFVSPPNNQEKNV